jgi:glycosyltransferase involved in cell wall biosynthesis
VRIALVNNFFLPRPSGSSHLTHELAAGLAARGDDVLVIGTEYGDAPPREMDDSGYEIVRVACVGLPRTKLAFNFDVNLALTPRTVRQVRAALDRFAPDVVHAHGQFFDLTWQALAWARSRGVPAVVSIHTRLEHPTRAAHLVLSAVDRSWVRVWTHVGSPTLVVMDRLMDDYIDRRYHTPASRRRAIPVGVDPDRFVCPPGARAAARQRLGIAEHQPLLASIGHVIPVRNRITLVRSLPEVLRTHPDLVVAVAGDVYDDRFIHEARRLGVDHAVRALGKLPREEVPALVAASDVEAHDLEGIGLGTASLEVMAAGVPTIAAVRTDNFLGVELKSWHHLVLVEPGDERGLADAVLRLLADRAAAAEIGRHGAALVHEHFSTDAVVSSHQRLYDDLVMPPLRRRSTRRPTRR